MPGRERRPLTRQELRALVASLESVLLAIEGGELVASVSLLRRVEGAVVALRVALGERTDLMDALRQADDGLDSN